jgi:hypothetical protein
MICEQCHFTKDCIRKPKNGSRCRYYVKSAKIDWNKEFFGSVHPENAGDFDIEDVKKIVQEFERLCS